MKKRSLQFLLLAGMLCLSGCKEKKPTPQIPDTEVTASQTLEAGTITPAQSEEYVWGNITNENKEQLIKTENGNYFYDWSERAMHYYDNATGKITYLCNKPECRHDGNKFCVATNAAYGHIAHYLYAGKIYVAAWQETETQYQLKLLTMALDGSELSELMTVYTMEKTGNEMGFYCPQFIIHRDYAVLTIQFNGMDTIGMSSVESEYYRGTAIINLKTKEISYLDEEPFHPENKEIKNVNASGDYIFYCIKDRKKTKLHYYNLKTKEDKTCNLLLNFTGDYIVIDEKKVLYLRTNGERLCSYDLETEENLEDLQNDTFTKRLEFAVEDGSTVSIEQGGGSKGIYTDGEYIYIPLVGFQTGREEDGDREFHSYLNVYDKELKLLVQVSTSDEVRKLPEVKNLVEAELYGFYSLSCNTFFRYTGEEIHYEIPVYGTTEYYMYRLKRADLLKGAPEFEYLYQSIK